MSMKVRLAFQLQDASTDRANNIRWDDLGTVNLMHFTIKLEKAWRIVCSSSMGARQ